VVCYDRKEKIKKYSSTEEILKEFYGYRLKYYYKRKEYIHVYVEDIRT
jgi:DNA topoisomerase II